VRAIINTLLNWFRQLTLEKKVSATGLGIVGLYLLYLLVITQIQRVQLSKRGVYYIAEIVKIGSSKNGSHYYIEYEFQGKCYKGSFKPDFGYRPSRAGAFIFIRLLPDQPKVYRYLDKGEVPDCVRINYFSPCGWTEIPSCP